MDEPSSSPRGFQAALEVDNELLSQNQESLSLRRQLEKPSTSEIGEQVLSLQKLQTSEDGGGRGGLLISSDLAWRRLIAIAVVVGLPGFLLYYYYYDYSRGRSRNGKKTNENRIRDRSRKKRGRLSEEQRERDDDDDVALTEEEKERRSFMLLERCLNLALKQRLLQQGRALEVGRDSEYGRLIPKDRRFLTLFHKVLNKSLQLQKMPAMAASEGEGVGEVQPRQKGLEELEETETESANHDAAASQVMLQNDYSDSIALSRSTAASTKLTLAVDHLTRALDLNMGELDAATKLQLVQTAAQCIHTEAQHKQVEIGNESLHLKKEQNKLSQAAHQLNISEIEKRNFQAELQGFKSSCADSLVAGLVVLALCLMTRIFNFVHQWTGMLETCAHLDLTLSRDTHHTSGTILGLPFSYISLWAYSFLSSFLGRSLCLLKLVLARAGGYLLVLYMSGKLFHQMASLVINYEKAPVTVILLLLGIAVGSVLKTCVFHWGGNSTLFFALWMFLCCTHCAIIVKAPAVLAALKISPSSGRGERERERDGRDLSNNNNNNNNTTQKAHKTKKKNKKKNSKKRREREREVDRTMSNRRESEEGNSVTAAGLEPAKLDESSAEWILQWKLILLHLHLIVVLPAATGLLPFYMHLP